MPQYSYDIISEKLDRPVFGKYHYAAKVILMEHEEGGQHKQIWPAALGEKWGKTWEEAYDKMSRAVEEWIAQQRKE